MAASNTPPAVPGLVNLGNTCYINAALQTMASSSQLTDHISHLAHAFALTATEPHKPTLAERVKAVIKFIVQDPSDHQAQSHEQLVAQAAEGRFTRALHEVLRALQPEQPADAPQQQQQPRRARPAVHPGALLSLLRWYLPGGELEPGQQQDAAEALQLLCDVVLTEATSWHQLHAHPWQQHPSEGLGLRAILQHPKQQQQHALQRTQPDFPIDEGQQQQQGCLHGMQPDLPVDGGQQQQGDLWSGQGLQEAVFTCPHTLEQLQRQCQEYATLQIPLGSRATCSSSSREGVVKGCAQPGCADSGSSLHICRRCNCSGQQQQQQQQPQQRCKQQQAQQQQLPGGQSSWPAARLPVVFHCRGDITCTICGDRFPCSLTPFTLLPLSLPHQRLTVPRGVSLAHCLQRCCQPELVEGVECMRCSLAATLQHSHEDTSSSNSSSRTTHPQQTADAQQQLQQPAGEAGHLRARLSQLLQSPQPLPPLDYAQLVQQQLQLQWRVCYSPVVKQTTPVGCPAVLLLHLQRSAHVGGLGGKIQGWVRFPLQLEWPPFTDQRGVLSVVPQGGDLGLDVKQYDSQHVQQLCGGAMLHVGQGVQGDEVRGCSSAQDHGTPVPQQYELMAVVEHLGTHHTWGHYVMYRRVDGDGSSTSCAGHPAALNPAAGSTHGASHAPPSCQQPNNRGGWMDGCSVDSKQRSSSTSGHQWVRVSDSNVQQVSQQEVLRCQASLLLYQLVS